jgi:Subtilase family
MRLRIGLVCLLAMAMGLAPVVAPLVTPLSAQDAGDGDDDDDGGDGGDDDGDVGDPDDTDPGGEDPGGDDVGGDDPGGDDAGGDDVGGDDVGGDDVGGDDAGGDDAGGDDAGGDDAGGDDAGGDDAGGDDDGAAGGDDDDDGAAGGDDDGAAGGNDDGAAGGDDDGAAGGDDDGTAGGDDDGGSDDITDDRGDGDDTGDTDLDDDPGQWESIGGESEATRAALDERDRIDLDGEGFRYRRGEFIALDLAPDDLAELTGKGFEVVAREQLAAVDGTLLLLRGPSQLSGEAALDTLEDIVDPDSIGYNHLFDSSSVQTKRARAKTVPDRQACGCEIGLIDTGVATSLAYFKHVSLVQRAFNAKDPLPKLHGTAVAHLMAGTKRSPERATKIFVADIFGGPRETSGSSFALIKALDWLAAQGVPVINISLSGPRNPAVAKAIARVSGKGHTIVAAAGNDGPAAPPVFPGAYDGVVGVTAVDGANRVYRYANRGTYVDFSARGVAVPAIDAKGAVRDATGTSFAAPIIAARLAAQLRGADSAAAQKAIRALEAEARDLGAPGRDPIYGAGLIGGGN